MVSVNASSANFTGGFGILEINHNLVQLNLNPKSNKSFAVVNGTDVEVQWQGRDRLLITPMHGVNHGIAGCEEYEVRVYTVEGLKDREIISLAPNGHTLGIDVYYDPEKRHFSGDLLRFLVVFLCISFYSAVVVYGCVRAALEDRKKIKQPRSSDVPTVPTVTPQ